jgi:hypothetical protein
MRRRYPADQLATERHGMSPSQLADMPMSVNPIKPRTVHSI